MSNETQWTPGPWKIEKAAGGFYRTRRTVSASVFSTPGITDGRDCVAEVVAETEETAEANARLIAAAPEMAALLERYVECEFVSDLLALDDKARALLAKIKG